MFRLFLILLGMAIWVIVLDAFISVTWPAWALWLTIGITFLTPGYLFANKMEYGRYLLPWPARPTK